MKRALPSSLLVVLAGACAAEPTAAHHAAVTSATDDDGDPAVVALLPGPGTDVVDCTGTLIAARVVLTAAHCVRGPGSVAFFGAVPGGAGTSIGVVHARRHPLFDDQTRAHDVALLLLGEPAPVAPVPLASALDASLVDGPARLVGFGRAAADDETPGRRRTGVARLDALDPRDLTLGADPSLACTGDSGGPVFVTIAGSEVLAGVVSGGDEACADFTRATRADVVRGDFIAPFVAATADGAAGPGERCFYAAHCASGACLPALDEPQLAFCSDPCTTDPECGALVCEGGQCRHPAPSPGALGSTCTGDAACVDGLHCAADTCTLRCFTDVPGSCPDGYACTADPSAPGADACFATSPSGCGCRTTGRPGSPALTLVLLALLATRFRRTAKPPRSRSARR